MCKPIGNFILKHQVCQNNMGYECIIKRVKLFEKHTRTNKCKKNQYTILQKN